MNETFLEKQQNKKEQDYAFLDQSMQEILPYLEDGSVTDISCRQSRQIIVKRFGAGKIKTGIYLPDNQIQRIIRLAANAFENKIDYSKGFPKLETLLPQYEARFTGLLPPCVRSAQFTIRKPPHRVFTLEEYLQNDQMTVQQYETIISYIQDDKNILIGGGTGSGKSTLLNAVIDKMVEINPDDCYYIVEDVPELRCNAAEKTMICVSPEISPEAVYTVLRWTSEHVIFGELRFSEMCISYLNVLNTGHTCSASTIHANNATMMLSRIRDFYNQAKIPMPDIRETIHLFIHLSRSLTRGIPVINEVLPTQGLGAVYETENFLDQYKHQFNN